LIELKVYKILGERFMGLFIILALLVGGVLGYVLAKRLSQSEITETVNQDANDEPVFMVSLSRDYQPEDLAEYIKLAPQAFKQHEGTYLARATDVDVLEGQFNYQNFSLSYWPSVEKAKEFWHSQAYTEAKEHRQGVGDFNAFLVKALPKK
jgi:uncharacterized protein (DUF1330 family)